MPAPVGKTSSQDFTAPLTARTDRNRKIWLLGYYLTSLVILVLDQFLKGWVSTILPLCQAGQCESLELLPVFKLTLLHNYGAAFSFLNDAGGWQRWFLIIISSLVSGLVCVWLWRTDRQQWLTAVALVMILGGALGNLVDRASTGYVVDFFVLHYEDWYFPAFNIADAAISIGAGLLILDMLLHRSSVNG